MNVNKPMRPMEENYGYDRSRVALAPNLAWATGYTHEQGAKATLLRCKPVSFWFKRSFSVITVSSEAFRRRGKRSEKLAVGGALYA